MKKTLLIILSIIFLFSISACSKTQQTVQVETSTIQTPASTLQPTETVTPQPTDEPESTPVPTVTPQPTTTPKFDYIGMVISTAADFVNIRQQPNTDSDILGQFPGGEQAGVIDNDGEWVHIYYKDIEGYVHRDYTVASSSPSVEVPSGDWAQILVNPTHLLPDDYEIELSDFEGGQINTRIFEIATAMFEDAAEDGVEFKLVDSYRSYDTQAKYYEEKVQYYIDRDYSREDAETKAATITARPNTSEHQAGLALDIVTPSWPRRNSGFADTAAFKWLDANAYKYGFIQRYPKGKEDITKVIFEPWHWRFVGVEIAAAIEESGQCFEEYLGEID